MADLGTLDGYQVDTAEIIASNAGGSPYTWKNRLAGTVTENGTGSVKRVTVTERASGEAIGSTFSAADGTWEIRGIPERLKDSKFIVIAFDDTATYNAQIADHIAPVL